MACREAVQEFVKDKTGMDGRIGTNIFTQVCITSLSPSIQRSRECSRSYACLDSLGHSKSDCRHLPNSTSGLSLSSLTL